MAAIYHLDEPYSQSLIIDENPSLDSGAPLMNSKVTKLIGVEIGPVAKAVGDSSVTFTNSLIKTTSDLHLISENSANKPIFWSGVSVSNGSVTYTFPALTSTEGATNFWLKVINDAYIVAP